MWPMLCGYALMQRVCGTRRATSSVVTHSDLRFDLSRKRILRLVKKNSFVVSHLLLDYVICVTVHYNPASDRELGFMVFSAETMFWSLSFLLSGVFFYARGACGRLTLLL